jgi:hypothetical protein
VTIAELHQNRNIYKVGFSYNNYYKMTKKGLVNKIAKVGAVAGLSLLPVISNGQTNESIQRGVNAATFKGETPTHYVYHFNFNKDLQRAIKNSKQPQVYITGDSFGSYLILDPDNSGYTLHYSKKNVDTSGKGKKIGLTVREKGKIGVCDTTGLGSEGSFLPSFYWEPTIGVSEQPTSQPKEPVTKEVPKEPTKESVFPGSNYNITNINNTTNNNYYGDTAKVKQEQQKLSSLELRTLIEGGKTLNPLNSPFWQASINPQIGRDWLWFGPYATFGFGSENNSTETPVYKKILLSQAAQIFTETEGIRTESSKLSYPIGFGGTLSLNTNDNKVRFDLSYGLVNKVNSTSDVTESGFDRKLVGNNIIEEKPYNFTLEEGETCQDWVPTQAIGLAVQPSQKVPIYLEGSAMHVGKISSKKGPVYFNVALGGNLGWRKK